MNQTTAKAVTAASGKGIRARWNAVVDRMSRWIGHDLLAVACRISLAALLRCLIGRSGGTFSVDKLMKVA